MPPERLDDVEEAWLEALDVKDALAFEKHKAAGLCWAEESVPGPHPGCAEFAPPEWYMCPNAGEMWVFDWEHDVSGPPIPEWALYCRHHAEKVAAEDVYRGIRTTTARHG